VGSLLWPLLLVTGPVAGQDPVLNEVCYDPAGTDAGAEFVELFNPGPQSISLTGVRLEFANGATAPDWQVRWTGGLPDSLAAGGFFLIVDRGWSGEPAGQVEVGLALQNGPDAVRLVLTDGTTDRLGYGDLTDPAFSEGTPAPDVASGQSLGRKPDGKDTDDNAADWWALAEPTPGGPNFALQAAVAELVECEPPSLAIPGGPVELTVCLTNTGLAGLGPVPVRLEAEDQHLAGWLETLPPEQSRLLAFSWQPDSPGRFPLRLVVPAGGDFSDLILRLPAYQVGQTGAYLSEVMAAPVTGAGEWIEVGNAGSGDLSLADLVVRDEDGDWRPLPAAFLAPDRFAILVQDPAGFAAWWEQMLLAGARPACSQDPVLAAMALPGSWPSLNNSPPADRSFADRVYLGDGTGTVLDHVELGGGQSEVQTGRTLERVAIVPTGDPARNWAAATSQLGSSPGCPNGLSLTEPVSGPLTLHPNPFYPGGGPGEAVLHLLFTLASPESGWEARVFDLWGKQVRDLGGDGLGPGPRDVLWDGKDDQGEIAPPGGYVILLRTFGAEDRPVSRRKKLAVIGNGGQP